MKTLREYMRDNNHPLTEQQELLIIQWLRVANFTTAKDLAEGMENHIKERLFQAHIAVTAVND